MVEVLRRGHPHRRGVDGLLRSGPDALPEHSWRSRRGGQPAPRAHAPATWLIKRWAELPDLQVIDVRNPGQVAQGSAPGALQVPQAALRGRLIELDPGRPNAVYCAGGVRCVIAASLLEQQGFIDVSYVLGGYDAIARESALSR